MISVIIPIYNAGQTLPAAIESIIRQTYGKFELLLIDNNSTDGSFDLCQRYQNRDSRIRLLSCRRPGVSAARNTGIDAAAGEYLFFMDADDDLAAHALETLIKAAVKTSADVVIPNIFHHSRTLRGKEKTMHHTIRPALLNTPSDMAGSFARLMSTYLYFFPFKLYTAALIRQHNIYFTESVSLGEDLLFNLAVLKKAQRIQLLAEPLYHYRYGGGLNSCYRNDFVHEKRALEAHLYDYLKAHGLAANASCLNQFGRVLLNDMYACIDNIFKAEILHKSAALSQIHEICTTGYTSLLYSSRLTGRLTLMQKAFYLLCRHDCCRIIYYFFHLRRHLTGLITRKQH